MDYSCLTDVELVRILRAEGGLTPLESDMLERIEALSDECVRLMDMVESCHPGDDEIHTEWVESLNGFVEDFSRNLEGRDEFFLSELQDFLDTYEP